MAFDFSAYGGPGFGQKDLDAYVEKLKKTGYYGMYAGSSPLYDLAIMAAEQGVSIGAGIQEQLRKSDPYLSNKDMSKLGFAYIGDTSVGAVNSKNLPTPYKQWRWNGGAMASGPGAGGSKPAPASPESVLNDYINQAQQTIADIAGKDVEAASDPLAGIQSAITEQSSAYQKQVASLQEMMIQQQTAYQQQMAEAQRQQTAMAAQAAEAQRQAMAVANAYVPSLEPSAAAPALGDARDMTRSSAANTLSNLSILTGMGISGGVTASPAAPLAGLQIA